MLRVHIVRCRVTQRTSLRRDVLRESAAMCMDARVDRPGRWDGGDGLASSARRCGPSRQGLPARSLSKSGRWRFAGRTTLPLGWSVEMAYVVGSHSYRRISREWSAQINFKSKDREHVATYLRLLGRTNTTKESKDEEGPSGPLHAVGSSSQTGSIG